MVFVLKFPFLLLFFKFIQYNFKLQSSLFLHHHVREKPWARLEQIVPQPLNFSFSCTEHLYPGNFFFSSFEGIPCDRGYTTKVNFPLSSLDNNFLVTHSQPASKVCFMKFDGDQWSVTYARLKEPPYYPLSLWWDQVIPESFTIVFKVCLTYIRTPVDNGDLRFNVPNNCPW